jgi:hypothetical protein
LKQTILQHHLQQPQQRKSTASQTLKTQPHLIFWHLCQLLHNLSLQPRLRVVHGVSQVSSEAYVVIGQQAAWFAFRLATQQILHKENEF